MTGTIPIRTTDGQIATVHFAGVANILPGLHLVVGLPANLALHDLVAGRSPRGRPSPGACGLDCVASDILGKSGGGRDALSTDRH